ncbi:MAG: hypothetical protein AAF518_13235, partial [Spirochaetota bacterium]
MNNSLSQQVRLPLGTNLSSQQKLRVLIAEDSKPERMLLKKYMLQEGFLVVGEAADGLSLLNYFKYAQQT